MLGGGSFVLGDLPPNRIEEILLFSRELLDKEPMPDDVYRCILPVSESRSD